MTIDPYTRLADALETVATVVQEVIAASPTPAPAPASTSLDSIDAAFTERAAAVADAHQFRGYLCSCGWTSNRAKARTQHILEVLDPVEVLVVALDKVAPVQRDEPSPASAPPPAGGSA